MCTLFALVSTYVLTLAVSPVGKKGQISERCILDMVPIDAYVDTPGGIPSVVGDYCKAFLDRKLAGSRKRGE